MNYQSKQIEEHITSIREKADRAQKAAVAEVKEIHRDTDLSEDGKNRRISEIRATTKSAMRSLMQEETDYVKQKKETLERSLFGGFYSTGHDIISTRDAQDRARRLNSAEEADETYAQAKLNGDTVLQKAIAQKAIENHWTNIVEEHFGADTYRSDDFATYRFVLKLSEASLNKAMAYSTWGI